MTRKFVIHLIITTCAALLFLPFLGAFHLFDWDEINFAEAAREMIVSGDWSQVQIGFEEFWEKPPLFIWLQAICMKVFGINEIAARLPDALCGIVMLNLLYSTGRKLTGHYHGVFWAIAYAGSLAPFLYFKTGIIDPVFNLFVFLSVYQWFLAEKASQHFELPRIHYFLAGLFAGLAVLTKGPVALLILGILALVRIAFNRPYAWPGIGNLLLSSITALAVASVWIVPRWISGGPEVFERFLQYQMELAGGQIEWHNQPWFYHILVLLFLCFPASIFALPHLFRNTSFSGTDRMFSAYMRALFWIVLLIFSIVTTKIIHYSSLCWIPLSWFAATTMYRHYTNRGLIPGWILICLIPIALLIGAATSLGAALLQFPDQFQGIIKNYIKDKTALLTIHEPATWLGFEWVLGIVFFAAVLIWILRFRSQKMINASGVFVITMLFSFAMYAWLLPPAEQKLQGRYISRLLQPSHQKAYQETWAFKSYATYFYGNLQPSQMKGPWQQHLNDYRDKGNKLVTARRTWCMDRVMDKPVFIYTRTIYQPDVYFIDKFKKIDSFGDRILWTRKDIGKPDMRINP